MLPRSFARFYNGVVIAHAGVTQMYYGKAQCYPGRIRWRPDHAPVFPGIEKIATVENLGDTGLNRDAILVKPLKPVGSASSRLSPGLCRNSSASSRLPTVYAWSSQLSGSSPGGDTVCAGIARCRPGYPRFTPDHPDLSRSSPGGDTVCPDGASVFLHLPVCPGAPRLY